MSTLESGFNALEWLHDLFSKGTTTPYEIDEESGEYDPFIVNARRYDAIRGREYTDEVAQVGCEATWDDEAVHVEDGYNAVKMVVAHNLFPLMLAALKRVALAAQKECENGMVTVLDDGSRVTHCMSARKDREQWCASCKAMVVCHELDRAIRAEAKKIVPMLRDGPVAYLEEEVRADEEAGLR